MKKYGRIDIYSGSVLWLSRRGVKEQKTMKAPVKRKSVNDIKTHAGTVDQTFLPHKAFMRISCLEMEKAHRIKGNGKLAPAHRNR